MGVLWLVGYSSWPQGDRVLNSLYFTIGGTILIALVVALIGPLFVDWTSYRAAFEREASLALGQPVRVLGAADMSILPLPQLHFESVHVGPDDQSPILVVDEFDMRIELFPLLQGNVEVVDMTLGSPTLRVNLDEQGHFAWRADQGKLWELDLEKIRLNNVLIEGGKIQFNDASTGRSKTINSLNGSLEARSLVGPYKIETSFVMDGEPYALMLSSGSASQAGLRLKSLLTPANAPITLSMDGDVKVGPDGKYHYIGTTRFTNEVEGLDQAVTPWRLTGKSDLTASSLVLPKFEFSHGSVDQAYRLSGAGKVNFGADPRFDVVLSSRQLDLDRALGEGPNAPIDLKEGVSKLAQAVVEMPLPSMDGHVGFDVPGVILGGGIIRNLQLDANLIDGGWQIETLEADFPGQTRFAMAGLFSRRSGAGVSEHAFEGEARVRSDQPTAFAKWWLKDAPTTGRLEPFDLSGQVVVKSDRISISSLDVDMDGDRANGQIDWYLGDGTKDSAGALTMQLAAERIDLDAVQGIGSLLLNNSSGNAAPLKDISLDVETDRIVMGEFEGQKLAAKLRLANGDIDIDRLVVEDFAGAHLSTKGRLENLAGTPRGHIEGQLKAQDMDGLGLLAARLFPDHPAALWFSDARKAFSPADFSFSLDGGDGGEAIKGNLSGELGGGTVALSGSMDGPLTSWTENALDLDLQMDNSDGQKLLSLAGLELDAFGFPALAANISFKGVPAEGGVIDARLLPETGVLSYQGTVRYSGKDGLKSSGDIKLQSDDLTPYFLSAGVPLSNPGLAMPVSVQASLDHSDNKSSIKNLQGQWDGQPVVGQLAFETSLTYRLLTGELELGDLDGIWLGESILGAGRLTSTDLNWPDTAFVAPSDSSELLPLKLELDVKARSLELSAPYIFQQPSFSVIWREDELVLSKIEALLEGGKVTGGLQLENVAGEAVLKSHLRVEGSTLSPFVWHRDGRPVANGQMDVSLNVESQGRSLAGVVSGLSGNGTFTITDGAMNYVNPQAFELVVRAVDAGLELDDAKISKAFVSHMDAGSTSVKRLAGAFRIAGGALRANNIEAEAEILQSRGNLMLDLSAQTINGDWSIKVEPNEEDAVTGAQPEVGLVFSGDLAAPTRAVDVAPFTGYLSIRAFEKEVDRVERLQADILEKERMRRLLKIYRQNAKRAEAERIAAEKAAELARQQAIEEAERKKKEAIRLEAERKAAEKAEKKRLRELEKQRKAEEARKAKEARKAAREAARAEKARKLAEEKARKLAEKKALQEAEAARKAEEKRLVEQALAEKAWLAAEAAAAKAEAARLETERLAEEARVVKEKLLLEQQEQQTTSEPISPNQIETRPLGELVPDEQTSLQPTAPEADLTATENIRPAELPELLFVLPQNPASVPVGLPEEVPVAPVVEEPATYNELIEQLRKSPDRIIQLD